MGDIHLSLMQRSEIQDAARVLSAAMLDNPLHIAILLGKGEAQRMEIETMFHSLLTELPGVVFLAKENQDIVGVMRMNSCQGRDVQPPEQPGDLNDINWRRSVWRAEWARRDPKEQHWHLGPIGVLPQHQGKGIGSMLMERFCREVDACGAQAYLETDKDMNVRFYEKFGFKLMEEADIFGVMNRYMLRGAGR